MGLRHPHAFEPQMEDYILRLPGPFLGHGLSDVNLIVFSLFCIEKLRFDFLSTPSKFLPLPLLGC